MIKDRLVRIILFYLFEFPFCEPISQNKIENKTQVQILIPANQNNLCLKMKWNAEILNSNRGSNWIGEFALIRTQENEFGCSIGKFGRGKHTFSLMFINWPSHLAQMLSQK